ncbi:MAG: putative zinc-binding protein [Armatimonadetes bacterium]|nr:putative zinc-binding protein [Armatimonadota bacterium]
MSKQCLCEPAEVLIVPCGGASNCGQATSEAAVQLTREGVGEIFCLAGLAAHIPEMIETARQARRVCVVDGCSLQCARKTVEHAGITVTDHLDLSREDVPKARDFQRVQQNVLFTVKLMKQMLKEEPKGVDER